MIKNKKILAMVLAGALFCQSVAPTWASDLVTSIAQLQDDASIIIEEEQVVEEEVLQDTGIDQSQLVEAPQVEFVFSEELNNEEEIETVETAEGQELTSAAEVELEEVEPEEVELETQLTETEAELVEVEPAEVEPAEVEPAEAEPAEVEQAEVEPAEVEPQKELTETEEKAATEEEVARDTETEVKTEIEVEAQLEEVTGTGLETEIESDTVEVELEEIQIITSGDVKISDDLKAVKGDITTTIRFDHRETVNQIEARNIQVSIIKDGQEVGQTSVTNQVTRMSGYPAVIKSYDIYGEYATDEMDVRKIDITVADLPAGIYNVKLTGNGYKEYVSEDIVLQDYSQHLNVGTNDATFTYGDITQDKVIDEKDLDELKENIKSDDHANDLNEDGIVDIYDLTMVRLNMEAEGGEVQFNTNMIGIINKIDETELWDYLTDQQMEVEGGYGTLLNIFNTQNQEEVHIGNKYNSTVSEENPVVIPIFFQEPQDMSQVVIETPSTAGGIIAGYLDIVYEENGEEFTMEVPFGEDVEEEGNFIASLFSNLTSTVHAYDGETIIISLGTRVAVKKISVVVEAVEGSNTEFVAVQTVTFIQDIVPEDPEASNAIIENLKVTGTNKALNVTWDKANNVGGYRIRYGVESGKYIYTKEVSVNSVNISGLENLKPYYLVVEAISGTWTGTTSNEVVGTPQPSGKPGTPTAIVVEEDDERLKLSWQAGIDTETFNVYIKELEEEDSAYTKIVSGITSTSTTINNLTNGTTYMLKISGTNCMGEGSATAPFEATPNKKIIIGPKLPTNDRIPSSNILALAMGSTANIDTTNSSTGFIPQHVADDDFATWWVAKDWSLNATFTFLYEKAYDMNYLIYNPAQSSKYLNNIDHFGISLWTEEDYAANKSATVTYSSQKPLKRYDEDGNMYLVFEFPKLEKVKKLSVSTGEIAGAGRVSLSEIAFYEYSSLDEDVKNLFANNTFTEIKTTVTEGQISNLEKRVEAAEDYVVNQAVLLAEIDLARKLLNGDENPYGYIKDDFVSIDNSKDDRTLSGISPLGVVGLARTNLAIYADIPEGETVTVYPAQYFAGPGTFLGAGVTLESGRNLVNVEDLTNIVGAIEGGAYYYKYTGKKAEEIKIHILNYTGVYGGVNQAIDTIASPTLELYDLGTIANADQEEVRARITKYVEDFEAYTGKAAASASLNPINSTDISTRSVLLSIPASGVWSALGGTSTTTEQKVDTLINTVLAWDELVYVTNTAYGDDEGERQGRQNFRYMRMDAAAYMYAAGNHVGIQFGSASVMINVKPTSVTGVGNSNQLPGWGPAHEIGHNLDRIGTLEVTNNIYSALAATWDGDMGLSGSSRVSYSEVFNKVAVGSAGIPNSYFVQLGMYWQLHQAYSGENSLEFYTAFNKAMKKGEFSSLSGGNRTAAIASKVAEKDLTEFFTVWGVVLSDAAKEAMSVYPVEERKIQYFTDDSREYRLVSGRSGITEPENYTITAEFADVDPKKLTLNIDHSFNSQDLQGFEIYRNNTRIGFTQSTSYTDVIGSFNNMAFTYSVQAIDKLGNVVGNRVYAKEVRIEYDDVIDASAYTVTPLEDGTGFKYTFKNTTGASGIIIANAPENGEFQVSIISEVEEVVDAEAEELEYEMILTDAVVAKYGDFSKNETLTGDKFKNYFIKPGAEADDTRIGIYDAKEIIVTGITTDQEVQFIASVGDNVSFTDYMMGRIGHDFDTGAGVIEEGSIIIVGEYIGDPYFNEIVLEGKYALNDSEDVEVTYVERAMAGDTYMFATVPENGVVSVISDGLFIFVPDVQSETHLQGLNGIECGCASILPASMKAIMNRTSDTGTRQTSETVWEQTPTYDTMPTILLQ